MKKFLLIVFALIMTVSPHIASANTSVGGLFALVNAERTKAGLPALIPNALLQKAAQEKVNDMVKNGYFAHTSPEGREFYWWMKSVGYEYGYAGENIVFTTGDSNQVMLESWMNSASHRASILSSNFTESGLAIAQGTYKGQPAIFAVQMFASPKLANQVGTRSEVSPSAPSINIVTGTQIPKVENKVIVSPVQTPASQTAALVKSEIQLPLVNKTDSAQVVKEVVKAEDVESSTTSQIASVTIGSEAEENPDPADRIEDSWVNRFISYISRWIVNVAQAFS